MRSRRLFNTFSLDASQLRDALNHLGSVGRGVVTTQPTGHATP